MAKHNYQACSKNNFEWQMNYQSHQEHADANCPNYLYNQCLESKIKCPCKAYYDQFNKN